MSQFFPIAPCCLKGMELPGEAKGVYMPAGEGRQLGRYKASPIGGSKRNDVTIAMFADVFMFHIASRPALS